MVPCNKQMVLIAGYVNEIQTNYENYISECWLVWKRKRLHVT
jgi:hypothetical protein